MKNKKYILIIIILILVLVISFILYKNTPKTNKVNYEIKYETIEYVTKNTKGTIITTNEIKYPIERKNDNEELKKIINDVKDPILYEWENFYKKEADEYNKIYKDENNKKDFGINNTVSTVLNKNNIISFKVKLKGAYGTLEFDKVEGYNYDIRTGKRLELKDLSNNYDKFLKYLYKACINYVNKESNVEDLFDDDINGNWKEIIKKNIQITPNWYLSEDGINLIIQKQTIAPSYVKLMIVHIDKNKINKYLKKEYKI